MEAGRRLLFSLITSIEVFPWGRGLAAPPRSIAPKVPPVTNSWRYPPFVIKYAPETRLLLAASPEKKG